MAYIILNTDGSTLLLLADRTVDTAATSLALVGRNVSSYGEYINNNFVKLTANFASSTGAPPNSPLKGQIWYDTTLKRLKVYDDGFKNISGAILSSEQPTTLATGDLWYDTTNNQLNIINGSSALLIGPSFPSNVGENGWVLPSTNIRNTDLNTKNVTLLKNYGTVIGALSNEEFEVSNIESPLYFNTTTFSLVSGLTILGDVSYTGKITSKHLTLSVDINQLTTSVDITNDVDFVAQTNAINTLLNALYPINTTTNNITHPSNPLLLDTGVPVGSEAMVVCYYNTVPTGEGYQIRKFIAKDDPLVSWDVYEINTATITATNVVVTIPKV